MSGYSSGVTKYQAIINQLQPEPEPEPVAIDSRPGCGRTGLPGDEHYRSCGQADWRDGTPWTCARLEQLTNRGPSWLDRLLNWIYSALPG